LGSERRRALQVCQSDIPAISDFSTLMISSRILTWAIAPPLFRSLERWRGQSDWRG
jgi:hypothetical protein